MAQAFIVQSGDTARGLIGKIENIFNSISWGFIILFAVLLLPLVGSSAIQSVAAPYMENKYGVGTACACTEFGIDTASDKVMCLNPSGNFSTTSLDDCIHKCPDPVKCENQNCAGMCRRTSAQCNQSLPYSLR